MKTPRSDQPCSSSPISARSASLDSVVSSGVVTHYLLADGEVTLHLPPPEPAQLITLQFSLVPTLAGRVQTGPSSISVGTTEVLIPPTRWTIQ